MALRLIAAIAIQAVAINVHAQNEEDALRLSSFGGGGTARSNGLANAIGAVGADPMSVMINPAGMALYRASALSFTSVLEINKVDARYYGTTTPYSQERFAVNNLALVLHTPAKEGSEWMSATWGVTYDRQTSQHWTTDVVGTRVPSTILEHFVREADGTPYASLEDVFPFTAYPVWFAYGIDTIPGSLSSYEGFIPFGSDTRQRHTIESHGATTRTTFFYSGNYKDRLYVGASVGVVGQRFRRVTNHTEYSLDALLDLQGLTYKEDLTTNGNGFDVNVGVIGRVTDRIRVGAAFQSPQWLLLNDAYFTEFSTTFRTPDNLGNFSYASTSPDGTFSYRLRTPWRGTLSASYLAGKNGLFSVDYDYADFRTMRYRSANNTEDLYDFSTENDLIKKRFRSRSGLRIGTEWRMGNWYFRGGWAYAQDPYNKNDAAKGQALRNYCGGLGYRGEHLTVDLAFTAGIQGTRFFQYDPDLVNATETDRKSYSSFLTIGLRP
ncbi:MAG: hypothetical protein IPP83_11735 [Flavobacteriales bacterium]|nr:hypothetical protein [Flavobacteriales bacterium]